MKGSRGYTLIEVMLSLGILAVGTTGVIALQKVALVGNSNARAADAARVVAGTWVERLKSDALLWNDPLGIPDIADTRWLNVAGTYNPAQPPGPANWVRAPEVAGWSSPMADIHGADSFTGAPLGEGIFCTHLQLVRTVQKPLTLGGLTHAIAIRALVRVVWRRDMTPMTECRTTDPVDIEADAGRYGFYYVSTVIGQEEASN